MILYINEENKYQRDYTTNFEHVFPVINVYLRQETKESILAIAKNQSHPRTFVRVPEGGKHLYVKVPTTKK